MSAYSSFPRQGKDWKEFDVRLWQFASTYSPSFKKVKAKKQQEAELLEQIRLVQRMKVMRAANELVYAKLHMPKAVFGAYKKMFWLVKKYGEERELVGIANAATLLYSK